MPLLRLPLRFRARRFGRVRAFSGAPAAALVLTLVLSGCGGGAAASFDPSGACASDGRVPGAYPELEARVPTTLGGRPPAKLDSGRNCSAANLATLANHGVTEIRFAGASWSDGGAAGRTLAVFSAPGLDPAWIAEWYEATASRGRRTTEIESFPVTVDGRAGTRIQLVNDAAHQVVVVWPSADGAVTQVLIASDAPTARIDEAIAAFP
jgi:hypothetical protein